MSPLQPWPPLKIKGCYRGNNRHIIDHLLPLVSPLAAPEDTGLLQEQKQPFRRPFRRLFRRPFRRPFRKPFRRPFRRSFRGFFGGCFVSLSALTAPGEKSQQRRYWLLFVVVGIDSITILLSVHTAKSPRTLSLSFFSLCGILRLCLY